MQHTTRWQCSQLTRIGTFVRAIGYADGICDTNIMYRVVQYAQPKLLGLHWPTDRARPSGHIYLHLHKAFCDQPVRRSTASASGGHDRSGPGLLPAVSGAIFSIAYRIV